MGFFMVQFICMLLKVSAIATSLLLQGSSGFEIPPSPATFSTVPPITEEAPGSASQPNVKGSGPSLSPVTHRIKPSHVTDPALVPEGSVPVPVVSPPQSPPTTQPPLVEPVPPSSRRNNITVDKAPVSPPLIPVPVVSPPKESTHNPQQDQPPILGPLPPNPHRNKVPVNNAPVYPPVVPVPVVSPPQNPKVVQPPISQPVPPSSHRNKVPADKGPVSPPIFPVPASSPPSNLPRDSQPIHPTFPIAPSNSPEPSFSPISIPPPSIWRREGMPVSAPRASYRHHHAKKNITVPAPLAFPVPPPSSEKAPLYSPTSDPKRKPRNHDPSLTNPGSPVSPSHSYFPSSRSPASPAPLASASAQTKMPFLFPKISPSGSSPRNPKLPYLPPIEALPPPPPNKDCSSITCTSPLTNTLPGSPCGCILPMQIGLRLSIALYTFFPLVSELASEIAVGEFIKQSQVRIMGANEDSQDPEKTIVLIDLVPLGQKFDNTTAYLMSQRLWLKQLAIQDSFFVDYEVLYVRYEGLPPSPPLAPSSISIVNGGAGNNGMAMKPLGVDVSSRQRHSDKLNGSVIAIIVLAASVVVILCSAVAWILLLKRRDCISRPEPTPPVRLPSLTKSSGIAQSMIGSGPISTSLSFESSIVNYTGSAKTFSSSDIERVTDKFNASRVLGEGGFGRVYSGVLEDGTEVAVKVLKRDDQQGGREFLAEVEMLSRLHHRNLVKLIGICTEERMRCLVYELIPNGSVESHLHGVDKETAPLDWGARMKIALGSARGLAYLHEDSSPRVIHRDFKSSNILLEHDFTPKVSDFGLARSALEEGSRHISTRVMGTFGYVAPEYAMTGHLLVKSDVYSYGVVLLELLTGRKPVEMSQPSGQENLVTWSRPLLTSKEGLVSIIDSSLDPDISFDRIAKVAAIASMCVQPEVSHRPFMGEVVQALKLICNECEETKDLGSRISSQENLSFESEGGIGTSSGHLHGHLHTQSPLSNYESALDVERGLAMSDFHCASVPYDRLDSGSNRRFSSSGPLRTGRTLRLWERMRRLSRGSVSEHRVISRLWPGSH